MNINRGYLIINDVKKFNDRLTQSQYEELTAMLEA